MTKRIVTMLVSSITALLIAASALPAYAATSGSSGNGLKISPVITNLTVNPGQAQTVTVYAQNVTQTAVTLQVVVNDFTAADNESGEPALLLNPNQYAPSHSLKRFVAPISNIVLQPGEQKSVGVAITVPKSASGGGYYGAVRFVPVSGGESNNVTLLASVASLILVRVPGEVKEDLRLVSFDVRNGKNGSARVLFTDNKGITVAARFENKGDIQEQPFGKILLEQNGKQIAAYEINDTTPHGNVLPDSIRKFTVDLDKVGAFGKYTLVGNFGYGSSGQLLMGSTTFYVIPLTLIVAIVLLIALILFFIFVFPRLLRRYNRHIVQKATRRR